MFQSILPKPPLLNFIPFVCLFVCLFCRSQRQSHRKVESLWFFWLQTHAPTGDDRGPTFQQTARRPRIVDDLGPWELKTQNQRWRAEGNRRHGWFLSRFSSILQG